MSWRSTRGRPARAQFCSMRRARCGRARRSSLTQHYPQPGWVEHDPEEIWHSVVSTCREAMAAADGPIAAIGIANQRETTVCGTARPAGRCTTRLSGRIGVPTEFVRAVAAGWACRYRRSSAPASSSTPIFRHPRSAGCSTTVPGLRRRAEDGEIAFGTVDSFLLWRLTSGGRHADRRDQRGAHDAVRYPAA